MTPEEYEAIRAHGIRPDAEMDQILAGARDAGLKAEKSVRAYWATYAILAISAIALLLLLVVFS